MKTSENIEKISAALVAAQAVMLPLIKDSNNPFFKSKYADLHAVTEACYPALQANGICVIQSAESLGELGICIKTRLQHSSGQFIETDCAIPPAGQDPQKYGSAVTYGRRYGLQAAVGLAPTDDDAEAATGRSSAPKKQAPSGPTIELILESFGQQTTIAGLDEKMKKAQSTDFKGSKQIQATYDEIKANLSK